MSPKQQGTMVASLLAQWAKDLQPTLFFQEEDEAAELTNGAMYVRCPIAGPIREAVQARFGFQQAGQYEWTGRQWIRISDHLPAWERLRAAITADGVSITPQGWCYADLGHPREFRALRVRESPRVVVVNRLLDPLLKESLTLHLVWSDALAMPILRGYLAGADWLAAPVRMEEGDSAVEELRSLAQMPWQALSPPVAVAHE